METLNQKEIQVLQLVADGEDNRRVAVSVKVSYQRVRSILQGIRTKLNADRTENAVATALRRGWID